MGGRQVPPMPESVWETLGRVSQMLIFADEGRGVNKMLIFRRQMLMGGGWVKRSDRILNMV